MDILLRADILQKELKVKRSRRFRYLDESNNLYWIPQTKSSDFASIINHIKKKRFKIKKIRRFLQRAKGYSEIDPYYYNQSNLRDIKFALRYLRGCKNLKNFHISQNVFIRSMGQMVTQNTQNQRRQIIMKKYLKQTFNSILYQLKFFKNLSDLSLRIPKVASLIKSFQYLTNIIHKLKNLDSLILSFEDSFSAMSFLQFFNSKNGVLPNLRVFEIKGLNIEFETSMKAYCKLLSLIPKKIPKVQHCELQLGQDQIITASLLKAFKNLHFSQIQLKVYYDKFIKDHVSTFFNQRVDSLKELNLQLIPCYSIKNPEKEWSSVIEQLSKLKALTLLNFSCDDELTFYCFSKNFPYLPSLKILKIKQFSSNKLDHCLKEFGQGVLSKYQQLEKFNFALKGIEYKNKLSDNGIIPFLSSTKVIKNLSRLKLYFGECEMSEKALSHLNQTIKNQNQLVSLTLNIISEKIGNAGWVSLMESLVQKQSTLKKLKVSLGSPFVDKGAFRLVGGLLGAFSDIDVELHLRFKMTKKEKYQLLNMINLAKLWYAKLSPFCNRFEEERKLQNKSLEMIKNFSEVMGNRAGVISLIKTGFQEMFSSQ